MGMTAGASSLTDKQKEEAQSFSNAMEDSFIYTIGSKPPSDGDAKSWAQQSFDQPMPITYRL